MHKSIRSLCFAAATTWGTLSVTGLAFAQAPAAPTATQNASIWLVNLDQAQQIAAQSRRPILIHFWNDNCAPCLAFERNVLSRPEVEKTLATGFVPVKIKVDDQPEVARRFRIDRWPVDVVVTADGQELYRAVSDQDAARYLTTITRLATNLPPNPGALAQVGFQRSNIPVSDAYSAMRGAGAAAEASLTNSAAGLAQGYQAGPYGGAPPADAATRNAPATGGGPAGSSWNPGPAGAPNADPRAAAVAATIPPGNPPLALDGYCPVTLAEQKKWKKADARWGAIHRDRTYIFAGAEEQQRFLANPDKYSPMLSGLDPVRFLEQRQMVSGRRQHGVWYHDQMYLFSDEASLQRFWAEPERYVPRVEQAMRGTAASGLTSLR